MTVVYGEDAPSYAMVKRWQLSFVEAEEALKMSRSRDVRQLAAKKTAMLLKTNTRAAGNQPSSDQLIAINERDHVNETTKETTLILHVNERDHMKIHMDILITSPETHVHTQTSRCK